ncbi:uncharacterized protein CEXT_769441 [Caerostris extrusa]|uniref:G domain-containing protein n=1 Tax=Caerostris extrusa TaxID=172846 RepID=A0AAV4PXL7_CAEEX|nr:uncharacterized protein CEXT_769441 [Caerostris extrusa]
MNPSHSLHTLVGLNSPTVNDRQGATNDGDTEIKAIFDLLENGEKEIKLSDKYKDVVLVLGNTGSGKSTFTQWLAGDNTKLISKEINEGEFIIEDNNRIGDSTLKSKTIFPELVVDEKTSTAYYDCPGFSDTRSSSNDIVTTYFIKKVLDHAESVKLVFVISYPSVRKGVDRQDFTNLLRHVSDLVKDIDKFKTSIALVATKVDNRYVKRGKSLVLVDDGKVIEGIAGFLQEAREYLVETSKNPQVSSKETKFYEKAMKFVDVLLIKKDIRYSKIGIFRRPDEPGPLSNITLLQEGKELVGNIIHEDLKFTEKDSNDFGYTISEKSKNDVHNLVEEINQNVG